MMDFRPWKEQLKEYVKQANKYESNGIWYIKRVNKLSVVLGWSGFDYSNKPKNCYKISYCSHFKKLCLLDPKGYVIKSVFHVQPAAFYFLTQDAINHAVSNY